MTKIKDEDVIQGLTQNGIPLDRWLALGSHLVGYFDETGRLMALVVEDDALASPRQICCKSGSRFTKLLQPKSLFSYVCVGSNPVVQSAAVTRSRSRQVAFLLQRTFGKSHFEFINGLAFRSSAVEPQLIGKLLVARKYFC